MTSRFFAELANNRYGIRLQDTIEYNGNTYDLEDFLSFIRDSYRNGIAEDTAEELLAVVSEYLVKNGYNDYIEKIRLSDLVSADLALPSAIALCIYDPEFLETCCGCMVDSFVERSGIVDIYTLQKTNQFIPYEIITLGVSNCTESINICMRHKQVFLTVQKLISEDLEMESEAQNIPLPTGYSRRYFLHKNKYIENKFQSTFAAYEEREKKVLAAKALYEKSLLDFSGELTRRIIERLSISSLKKTAENEASNLSALSPDELIARYEAFHRLLAKSSLPKPGVIVLTPGGKIYAGFMDGTVGLADPKRRYHVSKIRKTHRDRIISIDASPRIVCSLDASGQICVFNNRLRLLNRLRINGAVGVIVTPFDHVYIVTAHQVIYHLKYPSFSATVYSPTYTVLNAGEISFRVPAFPSFPYRLHWMADKSSAVYCRMYICGDTGRVALGFSNGDVYLDNGSECICISGAHDGAVLDIQVFGGYAFSGGVDGTIRMWHMADFSCLYVYKPDAPVLSILVTDTGLTSALGDGSIVVYAYK